MGTLLLRQCESRATLPKLQVALTRSGRLAAPAATTGEGEKGNSSTLHDLLDQLLVRRRRDSTAPQHQLPSGGDKTLSRPELRSHSTAARFALPTASGLVAGDVKQMPLAGVVTPARIQKDFRGCEFPLGSEAQSLHGLAGAAGP